MTFTVIPRMPAQKVANRPVGPAPMMTVSKIGSRLVDVAVSGFIFEPTSVVPTFHTRDQAVFHLHLPFSRPHCVRLAVEFGGCAMFRSANLRISHSRGVFSLMSVMPIPPKCIMVTAHSRVKTFACANEKAC